MIQADFVVASSRPQAERLKDHLLVAEVMLKNSNLQKGDQITQIDGQDVDGMKFEDASDLLNGQEGTTVKVTVKRNGFSSLLTLEVRRVNPILNKDGTPAI